MTNMPNPSQPPAAPATPPTLRERLESIASGKTTMLFAADVGQLARCCLDLLDQEELAWKAIDHSFNCQAREIAALRQELAELRGRVDGKTGESL